MNTITSILITLVLSVGGVVLLGYRLRAERAGRRTDPRIVAIIVPAGIVIAVVLAGASSSGSGGLLSR